ncbi:MAG: rhodanese-like domain-containing protein [Magnetococcales bacterium]|nr:rhodanese-like domain-containing protein [Magnetococcales bacterium]
MGRFRIIVSFSIVLLLFSTTGISGVVNIEPGLADFKVKHGNISVSISRNQDPNATIASDFAKTSRRCPPFCAQPMVIAPGVKTIGEVELIEFMRTQLADGTGLLVDARTPDWYMRGTIPGSINVPYTDIDSSLGAMELTIHDALTQFGAIQNSDESWDFTAVKTLVLWCNGPWCGQSPTAILGLIDLGYPVDHILYYRGGMQLWQIFGLTVLPPAGDY